MMTLEDLEAEEELKAAYLQSESIDEVMRNYSKYEFWCISHDTVPDFKFPLKEDCRKGDALHIFIQESKEDST